MKPQQLPKQGGLIRLLENHVFAFITTHNYHLIDRNFEKKMLL